MCVCVCACVRACERVCVYVVVVVVMGGGLPLFVWLSLCLCLCGISQCVSVCRCLSAPTPTSSNGPLTVSSLIYTNRQTLRVRVRSYKRKSGRGVGVNGALGARTVGQGPGRPEGGGKPVRLTETGERQPSGERLWVSGGGG